MKTGEWQQLTPEALPQLTGLCEFHDACVRQVMQEHGYGPGAAFSSTRLAIDAWENSSSAWMTLLIRMHGVRHWRVVDVNTFSWVLFAEPHMVRDSSGLLHVDFDTTIPSDHRAPAQMALESNLYWAAETVSWRALPRQASLTRLPGRP